MHDRVKSCSVKKSRISQRVRSGVAVKTIDRRGMSSRSQNGTGVVTGPLDYASLVDRVRRLVDQRLPLGATVAVVSKGDPQLVQFSGRIGWHFPRNEQGVWAGYHPADSNAAIASLEEARAAGADFFLLPQTFMWWLDHYAGFKRHLQESYRLLSSGEHGVLYELTATKENNLNQISMRVDFLLGVLYPLLGKLKAAAETLPTIVADDGKNEELTQIAEAMGERLSQIEQSLHHRAEADAAGEAIQAERFESLAEQVGVVNGALAELHGKMQELASADPAAGLEQKLREQEEFLTAQFERRLVQQRNEHDRHLQDQHVVMLRLLEEQQRLFQTSVRELDEKLSTQLRETTAPIAQFAQAVEKAHRQYEELRGTVNQKVGDLEALIIDQHDRLPAEIAAVTDQRIAESQTRVSEQLAGTIETVTSRLDEVADRITALESAPAPKAVEALASDETTTHQRRFNLSTMQAMDSIAAHLRALDARLNLLSSQSSASRNPGGS